MSRWLRFVEIIREGAKTRTVEVWSIRDAQLGTIKWAGTVMHESLGFRVAYPDLCRYRHNPEEAPCRGRGYCPRDPACNE